MNEKASHPAVPHPVRLRLRGDLRRYEKGLPGKIAAVNDWLASHLAVVFGAVWTVWTFFAWPLAAQFFSAEVQAKTSYYAQSWVQLFALPLFVWVGNRLQRSSDAQSDAQHEALTHIAVTGDDVKALLAQNTELTRIVHNLTAEVHRLMIQGALTPDMSGVLAEVQAVRVLVTPAEPIPGTVQAGSAGTAGQQQPKDAPAGTGNRTLPKRGGGTGSRA